jgi:hypothetical protein
MPQEKRKPSTAAERANEALDRATPEGKTPARRTLDFLLKGSHDEPAPAPLLEQNTPPNPLGTTKTSGTTSTTKKTGTTKILGETKSTVAPARDFQRVPNSVTRQAMASGLFRGKSKQVWDYLWSQSRAAIVPTRTVRRSRTDIKDGAGLGSINTVDAAVAHLELVGLITRRRIVGESDGNEFEVFTPEEIAEQVFSIPNSSGSTSITNQTGSTNITQKVVVPVLPESGSTGTTLNPKQSDTYGQSKTSFKTKEEGIDDDAHARRLLSKLIKAEKELTGKVSTNGERWDELGELLVTELRIAAARTTISNVPAFLTEHLRRRLWKVDKARATELASTQAEVSQRSDIRNQLSEQERRKCPDCAGVGFWYPEGPDRGVAKCQHLKLPPISPENENS